jgi:hypothetical protein
MIDTQILTPGVTSQKATPITELLASARYMIDRVGQ